MSLALYTELEYPFFFLPTLFKTMSNGLRSSLDKVSSFSINRVNFIIHSQLY